MVKNNYFLIVCVFCSIYCNSQSPEQLLAIFSQDSFNIQEKQCRIDSVLSINEKVLSDLQLADCYHDLGSKWFFRNWKKSRDKKQLFGAIKATKKAILLKKKTDSCTPKSLKKSLYNLGRFHAINKDIFSEIDTYSKLTKILPEDHKTQSAHRELGLAFRKIGDFHQALDSFDKIIRFYQTDTLNQAKIVSTYVKIADTYAMMGLETYAKEVQENIEKAEAFTKKEPVLEQQYQFHIDQIKGNWLHYNKKYSEAIKTHQKVLKSIAATDSINCARIHNSVAVSKIELGLFDDAKKNLKKAIQYNKDFFITYENLGDLYLRQDEFKKALFQYQKAINFAIGKKTKVDYSSPIVMEELELAADKVFLLRNLIAKANGWITYYYNKNNKTYLDQALSTLVLADELVDIIRSEGMDEQSKLFWRAQGANLYINAVEVCMLLNKPEQAFYFMERNKALMLLEDITNEQAKRISQLPQSIAQREFQLKRAIFLSENSLKNSLSATTKILTQLKSDIYKNKRKYELFLDSLKHNYPDYAKLRNKNPILPYKEFYKKHLTKEEVVLQYILNKKKGFGLLHTKNESILFSLDIAILSQQKLGLLNKYLRNRSVEVLQKTNYKELSNAVLNELIPKHIYEKCKNKKLLIITDNLIQQIPFGTLVVDKESTRYLIEDFEIRYAYSISYLESKTHLSRAIPKENLIAFAPINFDSYGLSKLNFSAQEIQEASSFYDGKVLSDRNASKVQFIEQIPYYKIVHLSTHADIESNANHWIAFSDSKLYLDEIYATKNNAEMIVLSACNTSVGQLAKGEGAMSLARGFFHSGAQSVVSSLWAIGDRFTKDLIVDFYKELNLGNTKSAALRNAKLSCLQKYRENITPAHWGALIVIGDNSSILPPTFLERYGLFLIITSVLVSLLLIMYYVKRKKSI